MISIKKRMALSYIFIIVITVFILEALIINIVRQNYYRNLEDTMLSQVKASADLYGKYFSDATIYDNVMNNVDTFWRQFPAQVQIIDNKGKVLMDSIGIMHKDSEKMADVEKALETGKGSWMGKVSYDDENVMAVSYSLKSQNKVVGVLRFVSSLREVNKEIDKVLNVFIIIGVVVTAVSGLISILLTYTIVGPLKEVTRTAEIMASGDFQVKSRKLYNDEIGKLSDTLNYMSDEIIKRDKLKNEFISSVSHELRTPLTSIKGWAITVRQSGPNDVEIMNDGLEIIEKECDRLTDMVEELLDFSRFVNGKVVLQNKPVDLEGIIEHLGKQFSPRAEMEGIDFEVVVDGHLGIMNIDENRLKQVFINIIENSFKFTPQGGKVIFEAYSAQGNVIFKIRDTGCGILPDELPRVKEKFFKGSSSKKGNGIGLSVCDEIISLMGGSLEINSDVGKGTETVVILPEQMKYKQECIS